MRLDDISDDELYSMYAEGDIEAFDTLFDRHRNSVYNFAFTMLKDFTKAEDVMQETFLSLARAAKTYEPRGRFRTWIMRIARNGCLNRIESERRRRAAIAESSLEFITPSSPEPLPLDHVETDERVAVIRQAVSDLPERQREAIALFAFERMQYKEIAQVLDMPINTVKTLIHRARASLARSLDGMP